MTSESVAHQNATGSLRQTVFSGSHKSPTAEVSSERVFYATPNYFNPLLRKILSRYASSFLSLLGLFPILASLVTLGIYFSFDYSFAWIAPTFGLLFALLFTLVLSIIMSSSATAEGANIQGYNMLRGGEVELSARLGIPSSRSFLISREEVRVAFELDYLGRQSVAALREAYTSFDAIAWSLFFDTGPQWVRGTGYVYTWGMIHRAEEALMEVDALPIVIREAIRDRLDLEGSNVENRDTLLKELELAVRDLDPDATKYLKRSQDDNNIKALLQEILAQRTSASQETLTNGIDRDAQVKSTDQLMKPSPLVQARARATLRQVKHALNKFREDRLAELIQARNNLDLSIIATGSITFILLTMVLLTLDPTRLSNQVMTVATAYYIIGAAVGLFARLYKESTATSASNDYGLSLKRLLATPLLSGLAAIGGVILFGTLILNSTPSASLHLESIFVFTPYSLLIAAIFGLTPNLLIKGLEEKSNKLLSDFESAKSGGMASSGK